MENKTFRLSIKELDDAGKFQGYLSVFNNIDHGGDLVEPGAFTKTLTENKAFPLLWAHSAQEPSSVVGTFAGVEDKHGLLIDGDFFVDMPGGREAYDTVKRLHAKKVRVGLSIGYKATKFEDDKADNQLIRRLKEIQLFEGSLTLFPMNDAAVIQNVKDNLEDTTKAKTVKVVCSTCGETVMEIVDPEDKAIDAQEPAAKATPENDPPAVEAQTERAVREFVESITGSIRKLTN
jgi:HK97 family phage prohead protease